MSDWDADSDEGTSSKAVPQVAPPKPAFGRRKFEDEDVEDEIQDDWEAEEEPVEKPDVSHLNPIKKKMSVKQKIKEKEEEERRRAELGLDSEDEDEDEDPLERKRREREAQIKADVENAANLLGTSKIANDESVAGLKSMKPSSKEDWEKYAQQLWTQLLKSQSSRPGFDKHFVPALSNVISEPLRDVDCRLMSTRWREMGEKKAKAEKEKKATGGKKKAEKPKTVGTASAKNTIDTRAYGDEALDDGDDLDFM